MAGETSSDASKPAPGTAGTAAKPAVPVTYRNVTKRYPGTELRAVEDLNLEVPAGEICVIVGPSGCGKTTAMRMANRMVEITEGDILIGDSRSATARPPSCAATSAT